MITDKDTELLRDVYIIIPAHNNLMVLKETLYSICPSNCHVVVVDDGSTDGTTEWIEQNYPLIHVLQGTGNDWWTGSLSKGIKYAQNNNASYIFSLNADVTSSEKTILQLIKTSVANDNAIVGSIALDSHARTTVRWAGSRFSKFAKWLPFYVSRYVYKSGLDISEIPKTVFEVDEVHGRGVLIPVEVIEKIGNYDHVTFPQYGGDTDFSLRARRAGLKLFVDPKCVSYVRSDNTSIIIQKKQNPYQKIKNIINYLIMRKHGEALRVWWLLLWRHIPFRYVLPSYFFIISINIFRRLVG